MSQHNDSGTKSEAGLKGVAASHRLTVICMDCGKQMHSSNPLITASEHLAQQLEEKAGDSLRVLRTTCLDFCPKDRVTVAVPLVEDNGRTQTRYFFMDPAEGADLLKGIAF